MSNWYREIMNLLENAQKDVDYRSASMGKQTVGKHAPKSEVGDGYESEEEAAAELEREEKEHAERRRQRNLADTKATFPNVKHFTKDGHPDWDKHDLR